MTVNRYATPLAFKEALEQRLRKTVVDGSDLWRVRQLIVFDRLLARVSQIFGDRVCLKGGYVLELRLERSRTTKDVDLWLSGKPEEVLARLQEAGRLDLGDYLAFEVEPDPRNPKVDSEGMKYEGFRYRARAMLAGKIYGAQFGVDVVFTDPFHGNPDIITGSRLLEFAGIEPSAFRIYPLETHLAEKIHAYTLPRPRPNTRVKDLPDLALLGSVRAIEAEALRAAVSQTFEHRGTHPVPTELPGPPESWTLVYKSMAEADDLIWPDIVTLMEAAKRFLNPLLAGRPGRWDPLRWEWK